MDWQKITYAVTHAQTLEPERLETFLQTLDIDSPDISPDVRRIIQQAHQIDAFMMTAVGDYLPPDTALLQTGDIIGQWKIETLIGSGGMGDVYKAVRADALYNQTVAIKVMKGQNERRKKRFDAERQRLAALNHPSIAKIIDGGLSDNDYPYMVMDYIEGQGLAGYVKDHTLSQTQILNLFASTCAAVTHAHNKLILHRDLKSENILIDPDEQVKLVDFGISKLLSDEDTEAGPFSLATAAPEQLNNEALSTQTDIFALGMILHQLLTGELPIRQPNGAVSLKLGTLPPDLGAILTKALQTQPSDRYDSVSALSADIKAYQTARPVNAYSGSPVYKFTKLLKRAPIASALAASFVAALTIGLGTSQHYASKATAEAKRANIELERAEWALGNATTQNAVAESYADALQRTIGGEDDVKRVRDVFMAHWENIVTNPESSDDVKAHVSFALGKHLIEQGDFVNGVKVLEPWLEDDYGSYTLRRSATALLGTAYTYQNRGRDALKKIMDVATMYEGEFDENSPAHVKASIKAAYYSHRPDIMQKAKDVAMKTLQTDITITERWDIWNQIMNLELLRGDFHGAYDATLEGKKLYATTVGIAATDIATVNVNYCELTFFVKRKNNDTKVCLENLLNSEHEQLALISSGVEIFSIKALLAREEEELLNAEAFIQTALTRNFNGTNKDNPNLKDAEIYAVMIKSDLGKWDEAKRIIDRAKTRKGRHAKNDIAIMEAYFLLKQQGQDAMMVYLKDSEFNKKYARAFFRLVYIMDEMTDLGVAWDAL